MQAMGGGVLWSVGEEQGDGAYASQCYIPVPLVECDGFCRLHEQEIGLLCPLPPSVTIIPSPPFGTSVSEMIVNDLPRMFGASSAGMPDISPA